MTAVGCKRGLCLFPSQGPYQKSDGFYPHVTGGLRWGVESETCSAVFTLPPLLYLVDRSQFPVFLKPLTSSLGLDRTRKRHVSTQKKR